MGHYQQNPNWCRYSEKAQFLRALQKYAVRDGPLETKVLNQQLEMGTENVGYPIQVL